jgi:23S rRNA (uracil1939-C5)-methyltransferase
MTYAAQLQAKAEILVDQLQRIGGLKDPPVRPAVASPRQFNYRNYVQFSLSSEGKLGFQMPRSNQVVVIQECHLPEEPLNATWPQIDLEAVPGLERVGLRLGAGEDVQLILESRHPEPIEFSVEDLPLSAVHLGPGGALVLAGSEQVVMEVLERPFQVSAGAFFQVNTDMAAAMVEHLLAILPVGPGSTVLDVYCGVGLFSAFLAPRCARLVGIEASPEACEDFAVNLDEFDHVELYEAPAEEVLSQVQFKPDVIVVDPPRSGLEPRALDGLLDQGAAWLAYISCDPATLARDARRLAAGGYQLEQVTPFDLFPQTYHIESISLWKRTI